MSTVAQWLGEPNCPKPELLIPAQSYPDGGPYYNFPIHDKDGNYTINIYKPLGRRIVICGDQSYDNEYMREMGLTPSTNYEGHTLWLTGVDDVLFMTPTSESYNSGTRGWQTPSTMYMWFGVLDITEYLIDGNNYFTGVITGYDTGGCWLDGMSIFKCLKEPMESR